MKSVRVAVADFHEPTIINAMNNANKRTTVKIGPALLSWMSQNENKKIT